MMYDDAGKLMVLVMNFYSFRDIWTACACCYIKCFNGVRKDVNLVSKSKYVSDVMSVGFDGFTVNKRVIVERFSHVWLGLGRDENNGMNFLIRVQI